MILGLFTGPTLGGAKPAEEPKARGKSAEQRAKTSSNSAAGALHAREVRSEFESFRLKDFHKDLGSNFLALFSSQNILPLAAGTAAVGLADLDDETVEFFSTRRRFGKAEAVFGDYPGKSWIMGGAIGTMILVSQFKGDEKFRAMSYSLGQGFALNGALTFGIKKAVGRQRPDGTNSRSFPSGHTSQAFMFATIYSHYNPGATIPAYLAAGFIGASRLDKNKHFLSDVVAGAALGYIVGKTVVRQSERESRFTVARNFPPVANRQGSWCGMCFKRLRKTGQMRWREAVPSATSEWSAGGNLNLRQDQEIQKLSEHIGQIGLTRRAKRVGPRRLIRRLPKPIHRNSDRRMALLSKCQSVVAFQPVVRLIDPDDVMSPQGLDRSLEALDLEVDAEVGPSLETADEVVFGRWILR